MRGNDFIGQTVDMTEHGDDGTGVFVVREAHVVFFGLLVKHQSRSAHKDGISSNHETANEGIAEETRSIAENDLVTVELLASIKQQSDIGERRVVIEAVIH